MPKTTKIYPISASLPRTVPHEVGQRLLYKVDPKDGTPFTYVTLQRHDVRYRTHTNSYYVKISTGKRIPAHVIEKYMSLGLMQPVNTSPAAAQTYVLGKAA